MGSLNGQDNTITLASTQQKHACERGKYKLFIYKIYVGVNGCLTANFNFVNPATMVQGVSNLRPIGAGITSSQPLPQMTIRVNIGMLS